MTIEYVKSEGGILVPQEKAPEPAPPPAIDPPKTCHCGQPFAKWGKEGWTLLGYSSPAGHDHDDNCLHREYECAAGHATDFWIRRSCPACDWTGMTECFCHQGPKLLAWPEVA